MHQVDLKDAQSRLPDLIDEAINGEEVVIIKERRPMVRLVPISANGGYPVFGSANGLIEISEDFDAPMDDFRPYTR